MKSTALSGIILCSVLYFGLSPAYGQSDGIPSSGRRISWGVETDFNSKYLWRGLCYNDGLVIQPNLWASSGNFTAGIWGNIAAWDRHQDILRHEVDAILTYTYSLGKFEIDHTAMVYFYPGQEDSPPTGEIYTGVSYPIGNFSLTSSATVDFLTYPGALYFEHGAAYEKPLGESLLVSSSIQLGWASGKFNETYVGTSRTSLNLLSINLELSWYLSEKLYLKPHVQVNRTLSPDLYPFMGKYPWFGGVLIGMEF